jgi:hypothetical protein
MVAPTWFARGRTSIGVPGMAARSVLGASARKPASRVFAATPTMVSSCRSFCSFAANRCPTAARLGKCARAYASLTIATGGAPRLSDAAKARPDTMRTRNAAK